eukprot:TRINITY_DN47783_c0_g1_i1.p1 TRINITY_DN47783_c0_g1~~TRINITY_DN47783_c0_g1_i1.p1  ORF type:complete len:445 (+),score=64.63 TRINITY_DN47783_c0_g1_i1:69-1337(+)
MAAASTACNGCTVTAAMKENRECSDLRTFRVGGGWLRPDVALMLNSSARAMADFVAGLPKAELHVHVEGCLEPELMLSLLRRNGLPHECASGSEEEWCAAQRKKREFQNLQGFLDLYYSGCDVLKTESDFYDLGMLYFHKASSQNIRRAEVFFDPQTHMCERGSADMATVVNGLHRACVDAKDLSPPVSAALIMCFLRHRHPSCPWEEGRADAEEPLRILEQADAFRDKILGIGLDSSESGFPPRLFESTFKEAKRRGYRCVAHAGEEGPSDWVADSIDVLGVERIDHGCRCLEDRAVVKRLRDTQIPLTVCPTSNHRLQVSARFLAGENPVKPLQKEGLMVTVNSDDPAYFFGYRDRYGTKYDGYLNDNYTCTAADCGLSADEVVRLALNSFHASFCSDAEKEGYVREIKEYCEQYTPPKQ